MSCDKSHLPLQTTHNARQSIKFANKVTTLSQAYLSIYLKNSSKITKPITSRFSLQDVLLFSSESASSTAGEAATVSLVSLILKTNLPYVI